LQKVSVTVLICIICWSCASLKKSESNRTEAFADTTTISFRESLVRQNLTGSSFFIQKAEVEYFNGEQKQKFLAVIKFEKPDRYLISLKSKAGIEGARIFINGDSIIVYDRINKIAYIGKSLYLRKKFGFDQSFLPLLFGDFVNNDSRYLSKEQCTKGNLDLVRSLHGLKVHYSIDCGKRKVSGADLSDNYGKRKILFEYGKIKSTGACYIPRDIKINYTDSNLRLNIKIVKVESPWNGNVKYLPAKGYEFKELL